MQVPVNFTMSAQGALDAARDEARRQGRGHVGTEHLLLALSNQEGSTGAGALRRAGGDMERLRKAVAAIGGRTSGSRVLARATRTTGYTLLLQAVMVGAGVESKAFNHPLISSDHLWLSLLRDESSVVRKVLDKLKVDADIIRAEVLTSLRPVQAIAGDPTSGACEPGVDFSALPPAEGTRADMAQSQAQPQPGAPAKPVSALVAFGRDLTEMARQGKLDPCVGRDAEIARLTEILCLRTKNNACLVGEPGVGKTAVVEGLAQMIARKNVPEELLGKRVIQMDPAAMVAGAKYRGEFEARMKSLIDEVRRRPEVILFFDEFQMIVGTGRAEGSPDAANLMKAPLSRGELRCIGATTLDEYNVIIEKDGALKRRFQKLLIEPPSIDNAIAILRRLRPLHEDHHGVQVTDAATEAAVKLSVRYIPDRFLPDKAIDLMDEACVHTRRVSGRAPADIAALRGDIESLRARVAKALSAEDPGLAASLRKEEVKLTERLTQAQRNGASARPIVTEEAVSAVLSRITKIPLGRIEGSEGARLLKLEEYFEGIIIGQAPAIKVVSKALRRARTGVREPKRPIGSFLFLGPTGVGKTELAKQLAVEFCGSEEDIIQLDMSEYMEKHSVSRLIGAPPGYTDSEMGGLLTEAVRRKPHSVILFDEIEKAHEDIFTILLQVLWEGRLTDSRGRVADFTNALIVITTNVGAAALAEKRQGMGFGAHTDQGTEDYEKLREQAIEIAKKTFKPELLNRLSEMVVFRALDRGDYAKIYELEIARFGRLAQEQKSISMTFEPEVLEFFLKQPHDARYGARPLRRIVEDHLGESLSNAILAKSVKDGDCLIVAVDQAASSIKLVRIIPVSEQRVSRPMKVAPAA